MKTIYDQTRRDIRRVYAVARASTELQGVPSSSIDLMKDSALARVDEMEAESNAAKGCGGGCAGCMKRPSGLVGDPQ